MGQPYATVSGATSRSATRRCTPVPSGCIRYGSPEGSSMSEKKTIFVPPRAKRGDLSQQGVRVSRVDPEPSLFMT